MNEDMTEAMAIRDKKKLRQLVKTRVEQLSPAQIAAADKAIIKRILSIALWQQARTIFCYLSVGREITTLPLWQAALAAGKHIAAPLITGPGLMEARLVNDLSTLQPDRYGIPAPLPDSPLLEPSAIDLVIVPGMAFDRQTLLRLGRGGGYYDRYLAFCPAQRLAPVREVQLLEGILPAEEHDLAMDMLVSEQGLYLPPQPPAKV